MKEKTVFKCPVCGDVLYKEENTLKCEKRHSYDISSQGYVNLAMNQSSKTHGDDALMVSARRNFLSCGYYKDLCDAIADAVANSNGKTVLDAGCGEGYYTKQMGENSGVTVYGIDISKKAVAYASKICKGNTFGIFCVGSVYSMPYFDSSFDTIVNVFSPLALDEYKRLIPKGGTLILAVPNPEHLIELKRAVYDDVRIKDETNDTLEGFELKDKNIIKYKFLPKDTKTLTDLFSMTPYYYTTPASKRSKLESMPPFEISADFSVLTYKKI